jgi:hypothetical protein
MLPLQTGALLRSADQHARPSLPCTVHSSQPAGGNTHCVLWVLVHITEPHISQQESTQKGTYALPTHSRGMPHACLGVEPPGAMHALIQNREPPFQVLVGSDVLSPRKASSTMVRTGHKRARHRCLGQGAAVLALFPLWVVHVCEFGRPKPR